MKKLLRNVICAGAMAMLAIPANAAWYINGSDVNGKGWNDGGSAELKETASGSNIFTATLEELGGEFKINDGGSTWLGGNPLTPGTDLSLSSSGANIKFSSNIILKNATVKLTVSGTTYTLNITGTEIALPSEAEALQDYIYIIGNMTDWSAADTYAIPKTSDKVYKGTVAIPALSSCYFRLTSYLALGINSYQYGNSSGEIGITNGGNYTMAYNSESCWYITNWTGGYLTVEANFTTNNVNFSWEEATIYPEQLTLPGNFNDWDENNSYVLKPVEGQEGVYSGSYNIPKDGTFEEVTGAPEFKIYDGWNWIGCNSTQENVGITLTKDTATSALTMVQNDDNKNWYIANEDWEGGYVTFTVNYNEMTMTLLWEDAPVAPELTAPANLYLLGDLGAPYGSWNLNNTLKLETTDNGVFSATSVIFAAASEENPYSYFGFANDISDWDVVNDGTHRYGPATNGTEVTVGTAFGLAYTTTNSWMVEPGTYDVVVDFNSKTVVLTVSKVVVEPGVGPTPDNLYLLGHIEDNDWTTAVPLTLTKAGVFELMDVVTLEDSGDGYAYITFINTPTVDWTVLNDGTHRYGPLVSGTELVNDELASFYLGGDSSWKVTPGEYAMIVNFNSKKVVISNDNFVGIQSIGSVLNGEEVIYNLQGVRVDRNHLNKGIYIINGKKVLVK